MKIAFLIGRIIVGLFYFYNGLNHFIKYTDMSGYAEFKGVPLAGVGVIVSGLLLIVAALTLLLGKFPEIGVAALVVFFIPVTFMMHNFWAVPEEQQMAEMVNFIKNLALMGSALMFLGIKKPWPFSLEGGKGE
jgi:uncharacterized membrane protein YphA (DoxX/SURF4 family)